MHQEAIHFLQKLIATPSFSGEEKRTSVVLQSWLNKSGVSLQTVGNNIWAKNKYFDPKKPSVLLNSHHDTVKPNEGYTRDPFSPDIEDGKLYGLGSNDAGGCLVSLISTFMHFYERENLNYNLVLAASAEEENSGPNGIRALLPHLPKIDFAIVGEPTEMQMAIAEKGLVVIDAKAEGIPGHAANDNTTNPILIAMKDIDWIHSYEFPYKSDFLGKTKMSVTQINAGKQHNMVPAICDFVVDVRVNEHYTNEEVFDIIKANTTSKMTPRSLHLNSSSIHRSHPIVKAGEDIGREVYGSPTLSDQAHLSCPSLKMGPGLSDRSHSADEFIYLNEIEEGINIYIELLEKYNNEL